MPAPKFLSGLPKPLLFGLYGAVGGLLGALLFGEPAWRLLKPPPAPSGEPQIAVGASASVKVYAGSENTFVVRVARERFDGAVAVRFPDPPPGTMILPVLIPAGQGEAEARVVAAPGAPTGAAPVRIEAEAEGGVATATASVEVEVTPVPPPPPGLAVAIPANLTLFKRGTSKFTASIARRGFDGPVTVTAAAAPPGVTLVPATIAAGRTDVEVSLSADETVPVGEATVAVSVQAQELKDVKAGTGAKVTVQNPPIAPVDVVFVLDVTSSMQWAIDDLKNGIGKFADALAKAQVDFRLGLVTFQDLTVPGEKVNVILFKNKDKEGPFTSDAAVFRDQVAQIKASGGGDTPESSLEALVEAGKQPFRKDASKMILLITDAQPKVVPENQTDQKVRQTAKQLKDAGLDSVHIVVQRLDEAVYKPLTEAGADKAGGKYFNLGDVVRGDEGFDALLATFGRVVTAAALAKSPDARPIVAPPPEPPKVPAAAAAAPKGSDAPPPPSIKGVQSSARFAAGSGGRLTLAIAVWTGAIAALVCLALIAGQNQYLRGSLPPVGGVAAGLLGGLVVGLVGGAAGQGLFFLAPDNATLAHVFRVFGWALLGGLAGVGLSLFVPNMKWPLGLAGGAIGGAVGALGFIAVSALTGDLIGRLVGGLVLGFCIGLMVAVAEAAFRKAWLEVRYGERETIAVTLGPEPVKVGSDARACTVWARGAPPLALRFFVRDGQVICDDAINQRQSAVSDGFAKEVGNVTVTVRTGSGSAAPERPPPRRPTPPPARPAAAKGQAALSLDDDEGFELPMPVARSGPAPSPPPPARPVAAAPPAAPPTTTPPLPTRPAAPAPAPAPPKPPVPSRPPLPAAGSRPPAPPAPTSAPAPPRPAVPPPSPPAIKPTARDPDACPTCGRKNTGRPGTRYCMVCDQTY